MTPNLTLDDIVTHPIATVSAGFTAAAHLITFTPLDAIAGVVWANVAGLFTVSSLVAFTVAPNVTGIPENPFLVAAVVLAVGYALKIMLGVWKDYKGVT